jgi:hypothetical protein
LVRNELDASNGATKEIGSGGAILPSNVFAKQQTAEEDQRANSKSQ